MKTEARIKCLNKLGHKKWKKLARAKRLGHRWKNQIRRTLQEHFKPAGYGRWASA